MPEPIDRIETHCPTCGGANIREVSADRRFHATFPRSCPTKDLCLARIMSGWTWTLTDKEMKPDA